MSIYYIQIENLLYIISHALTERGSFIFITSQTLPSEQKLIKCILGLLYIYIIIKMIKYIIHSLIVFKKNNFFSLTIKDNIDRYFNTRNIIFIL